MFAGMHEIRQNIRLCEIIPSRQLIKVLHDRIILNVNKCSYRCISLKKTYILLYMILYNDVIMGAIASQITSPTIVFSTVYLNRSKKTSKLHVTGLCAGNSLDVGEFPAQMASNAENVSI